MDIVTYGILRELIKTIPKGDKGDTGEVSQEELDSITSTILSNFAGPFVVSENYTDGTYVTYTDGFIYVLPDGHEQNVTWANTTKSKVSLGDVIKQLKESLVQVSQTQPQNEFNKLWIKENNPTETQIPTYEEFNELNTELSNYIESTNISKYRSCVNKPINFSGKHILFFGDQITYGYIAASGGTPAHQATNQYPKVFSEGVGATYTNNAISQSTLSVVTGYDSIYTKIQNTALSGDYVFIAGGVNDWQLGVNESTLEAAVENICNYLNSNFNGEVVFITPINEAGCVTVGTPTQTLQNVRNVITRIALKYGYSVVQGYEFPFPNENDDNDYINLMFQDKINPTEFGYSMYAQSLRNAVC